MKITPLPDALMSRFIKLIFTGALIIIGSIIVSFSGLLPATFLQIVGSALIIGGGFILMALHFKWTVHKKGYDTYQGKCISCQFGPLSNVGIKKKPLSYIINCGNSYLEVPAVRINYSVPEGVELKVYTPKNVLMYERNGIKKPITVWGLELINDPEEEK